MTTKIILLYVTYPNEMQAQAAANTLIDQKLIACANLFPMKSIYRYNNAIHNESEVILILKTFDYNKNKIEKEIIKKHSYQIPCILSIDVHANREFFEYIVSELA